MIRKKRVIKVQALLLSMLMILTFLVPIDTIRASAEGSDQTQNTDIVRTLSLSYLLKGESQFTELQSPYHIEDATKISKYHAKYSFTLNDNIDENGSPARTMAAGDYYLINMPDCLNISNPAQGNILDKDKHIIADYTFIQEADASWQIKVMFTDYIDNLDKYEIYGELEFDFELDLEFLGDGEATTVEIPIDNNNKVTINVFKPKPQENNPVSLEKTVGSYDNESRMLEWNVKMLPANAVFEGCVFTDKIDLELLELVSVKHGSDILVKDTDYTISNDGTITYTIPQGKNGSAYQNILITTKVKPDTYTSNIPVTINNKANLSGGKSDVEIESNTASQTVTPAWLNKKGSVYQGNKIKWTIEANSMKQPVYDAVITEHLQSDVALDKSSLKLGDNSIVVYDDSHTPADNNEIYGVYVENPDHSAILKIYLPRGQENISAVKYNLSLVTDVVSPDTPAVADPVYNNSVSLECKYAADGIGPGKLVEADINQIGVGVPNVSISKGHSALSEQDKSNGTISWKISAASNLASYGKSQIVDTLPEDQDFIENEIYWGNTPIDKTTNPKAEVSSDGRQLVITFDGNEALQVQQNFTVKTRIKPEIYGKNLNRDFNNEVKALLYSSTDPEQVVAEDGANDSVRITNPVITKKSSVYNGNQTNEGQNPRVDFSITVNQNKMPLKNVIVTDDLNALKTKYKPAGDNSYQDIEDLVWQYVPGTLKITKAAGNADHLNLDEIANGLSYVNNEIKIDFGEDVSVNDQYVITFTAEMDVSQNEIFKKNVSFICYGNTGSVTANGLNGTITSPETNNSAEIKNEVLGKTGSVKEAEQQIVWNININQHRVSLDNSQIVDALPKGLTLDPTSIKLYQNVVGKDGNFMSVDDVKKHSTLINNFEYTYEQAENPEDGYVITAALPDNKTDYMLIFATDVDSSLLGKQISNSAYYKGDTSKPDSYNTSVLKMAQQAGGGSETKTSITVNKFSSDNGQSLDGAVFSLHWLKDGTEPVFVRNLTVKDGKAVFRGLTVGETYTVTEITAPEGYGIDNPEPVTVAVQTPQTLNFYDTPIKTGSWAPQAIKKLEGKTLARTFQFLLEDSAGILLTGMTQSNPASNEMPVTFTLPEGESAKDLLEFSDSYTFADTDNIGTRHLAAERTFTMREKQLDYPGYSFDTASHELTLQVYNVKGKDNLVMELKDRSGNVLTEENGSFITDKIPVFKNKYSAFGTMSLSAVKTLVGHSLEENMFSFELYEGNTLLESVGNQKGTLAQDGTYSGDVQFTELSYDLNDVGVKTYKILEKNNQKPGYVYDTSVYTIQVRISDNEDGTLSSEIISLQKETDGKVTQVSDISFVNRYTASNVNVNLTGIKEVTGHDLETGQFTFVMDQVDENGTFVKEIGRTKNTEASITLPQLEYTQSDAGTSYYYQIREENTGLAGYTYDSSKYMVRIDVRDNDDGTLRAEKTLTLNGKNVSEISFLNSYTASGSAVITASKTLTGKPLNEGQFEFLLQQIDNQTGKPVGNEMIAKNDSEGKIVFPQINYTQEDAGKDFYYLVSEVNSGTGGYTYDSSVYKIKIAVLDNHDGTLDIKQTIVEPIDKENITFQNTYSVSDLKALIYARKNLKGKTLLADQFEFTLNQVDENGKLIKQIQTVKNNEDGKIIFDALEYNQEDMGKTYYYQLSEVSGNQEGYEYDTSVYNISIQVKDLDDGTMEAIYHIVDSAGERKLSSLDEIIFENNYKPQTVMSEPDIGDDTIENQAVKTTPESKSAANRASVNTSSEASNNQAPHTGDHTGVAWYAAIFFASLMTLSLTHYKKKHFN